MSPQQALPTSSSDISPCAAPCDARLKPAFRWDHEHQLAVVLFMKWTGLSMFNASQLLGLNVATLNRFKTKLNPKELSLSFCPKRHDQAWVTKKVLEVIEITSPGAHVVLPFAA